MVSVSHLSENGRDVDDAANCIVEDSFDTAGAYMLVDVPWMQFPAHLGPATADFEFIEGTILEGEELTMQLRGEPRKVAL